MSDGPEHTDNMAKLIFFKSNLSGRSRLLDISGASCSGVKAYRHKHASVFAVSVVAHDKNHLT